MKQAGKDILVGWLVILVVFLLVVFAWLMGLVGPFQRVARFELLYSFAGGVELGSPVRVSGVKVGKVENIRFLTQPVSQPMPKGESAPPATLAITISVSSSAAPAVRTDSNFYVNMAGIIGERYIEISPGTPEAHPLANGARVRGVDPPRIDQLLSQGYGVFGRIQDFLDQNEAVVTDFLTQTTRLLKDANSLLKGEDKAKFFALVDNLISVTGDMKMVSRHLNDPENHRLIQELRDLVDRAHTIDKPALKKFLQDEGIRARIF